MTTMESFVAVRGNIECSRLLFPHDFPYATIRITNARILPRDPSGVFTDDEALVVWHMFQNPSDGPNGPWHLACFEDEFSNPARLYLGQSGSGDPVPIDIENELAIGLDVIVVMRVFEIEPESHAKSVMLHSVILQEPIRYQPPGPMILEEPLEWQVDKNMPWDLFGD